ncbi:nuclear transport factor 2 family protein [Haloarchaeobius sp. DFWS5]|uniref:nuclear transport factor 2 family protein n=1 Tax=Haloarchaeobius sp. DFWS5 TaxID=3446114 RepID=UPI003EBDB58D
MTENEHTPNAVVDRQLAAYNDGDIDGFLDTFAEDAVAANLDDGAVQAAGHAELREVYGYLFENAPDLHCEVESSIALGEYVVHQEHVTGLKEPMDALAVYQVTDGLIRRLWLGEA